MSKIIGCLCLLFIHKIKTQNFSVQIQKYAGINNFKVGLLHRMYEVVCNHLQLACLVHWEAVQLGTELPKFRVKTDGQGKLKLITD